MSLGRRTGNFITRGAEDTPAWLASSMFGGDSRSRGANYASGERVSTLRRSSSSNSRPCFDDYCRGRRREPRYRLAGGRGAITRLPLDATSDWVESPEFTKRFTAWCHALDARRDVFLGYCSKSAGIAAQIQLLLQRHGARVRNWAMDFRSGVSILNELEDARRVCSCGIFLFSEDDPLEGEHGGAAPRDNVVFEAGHFFSSKGMARCLIIRVGNAKMPADLGGAIYVALDRAGDVASIEGRLVQFLEMNI